MNVAEKLRTCPDCRCHLSIYNPGPRCWPCQEKKLFEELNPPAPPPKPALPKPLSPKKVENKPRNHGQYVPDVTKGTCKNCERDDLALKRGGFGDLCTFCRKQIAGKKGDEAKKALSKARKLMKGRGKMTGRGFRLRRKAENGRD